MISRKAKQLEVTLSKNASNMYLQFLKNEVSKVQELVNVIDEQVSNGWRTEQDKIDANETLAFLKNLQNQYTQTQEVTR